MLTITVPPRKEYDLYDEINNEFIHFNSFEGQTLKLEHSLVSLHRWESKWNISLLDNIAKCSNEQLLDYVRCMTITQNVRPETYDYLTEQNIKDIVDYMNAPMTATILPEDPTPKRRQIITAELIYYWMFTAQIPIECQKWHLNQLMTLIGIYSVKNGPEKKMSQQEIARHYAKLNAERRAKANSKG